MDLKEKELLLKDLSARLPYGVILNIKGQDDLKPFNFDETLYDIFLDGNYLSINNRGSGDNPGICEIKPYLRPMSSMTEEEVEEYNELCGCNAPYPGIVEEAVAKFMDWLNKHHFDYRGLIEKGLALEAPEGIYNIKEH